MNCPKCDADMEIIGYTEEYRDGSRFTSEEYIQEWECKCPECGYTGAFSKCYHLFCEEWDEVD